MVDVPALPAAVDALDTSWLDGVEDEPLPAPSSSATGPESTIRSAPTSTSVATGAGQSATIDFRCQHCRKPFRVGQELAGKSARCSKCGERMTVPSESDPTISSPTPAASKTAPIPLAGQESAVSADDQYVPLSEQMDDLLGELDAIGPLEARALTSVAPLPKVKRKTRASESSGFWYHFWQSWPDLMLAGFISLALLCWAFVDLAAGASVLLIGTFFLMVSLMFLNGEYRTGALCLFFCCVAIGPMMAAKKGFQNAEEWRSRNVAATLLLALFLCMFLRTQEIRAMREERRAQANAEPVDGIDAEPMGMRPGLFGRQPEARASGIMRRRPPADQMPNVTIANIACFQDVGSSFATLHFEYEVKKHPEGYARDYHVIVANGEHIVSRPMHSDLLSGRVEQTLMLNPATTIRVWIQFTNPPSFDDNADDLRVSEVATCIVQRDRPPVLAPRAPTSQDDGRSSITLDKPEVELAPLDAALAGLKEGDHFEKQKSLRLLYSLPVDKARRGEVAAVLVRMLDHPDRFVQSKAFEALETWHTPESIEAIVKQLDSSHSSQRDDAAKLLVKIKDPRTVPMLAEWLVTDRFRARRYLCEMGSIVEPEVITYLQHPDDKVREEACRVLSEVGTAASVPELAKLERDPKRNVYHAADRAIREIRSRHGRSGRD